MIKNYTGIDSPYEPPINPELSVPTGEYSIKDGVDLVLDYLSRKMMISPGGAEE